MVKARTSLPFAREAAELVFGRDAVAAHAPDERDPHFEARARSLDTALDELGLPCVLELASGLSMRGLDRAVRTNVSYLETDLPELAELKAELVARLSPPALRGTLRVAPLDALDPDAFRAAVASLPPGPLAIIHEGLLMYLDDAEKARLAANIREALRERGGAWVTADIYLRRTVVPPRPAAVQEFLAQHRVEDNKFADWAAAEAYVTASGFQIARKLPSRGLWQPRETWILTLAAPAPA